MTIYQRNIKQIEMHKSFMFHKLQEHLTLIDRNDLKDLDSIEMVSTLDEDTALSITKDSICYRLNSLYSPTHEAERWGVQFETRDLGIVASMFGLGNGVFAREMLRKLDGQGLLLIYEPCMDIFFYVLEHYDISDLLEASNVSITVEGINDIELGNRLNNNVAWFNLRTQIACSHPHYVNIFPEGATRFYKIIRDNNDRTIVNKNTDVIISSRLVDNTIKNLKLLYNNNLVTDLAGKFPADCPAIIVSAGPSLDKNIEELKRAKGHAAIFAVDSAVKYLLTYDIIPDFIVTLDPKKSLKHLKDSRCRDIPVFGRVDSRPENLETNRRRIIFYNLEGYSQELVKRLGKRTGALRSGGSVATGAFSICETLGFQRIILVGQDLAYLGDNTHAGGIAVDVTNGAAQIEMVEGVHGDKVKTRYDWYVYIRWFEDAVELFKGEEIIDATEGGAKIHGSTIMTLEEVINQYCTTVVDCDKIIDELIPAFGQEEREKMMELIHRDIDDLMDIKRSAIEAWNICKNLIQKYERSLEETTSSIMKNQILSEYNADMEKKPAYNLVDWDMVKATSEHLSDLYIYSEDEKENKLKTYEQAKIIYKAIENSAERILPMLQEQLSLLEGNR